MSTKVFVARSPSSIEVVVCMPEEAQKTYVFKDIHGLISKTQDLFELAASICPEDPKDEDALYHKEQALALVSAFEQLVGNKRS